MFYYKNSYYFYKNRLLSLLFTGTTTVNNRIRKRCYNFHHNNRTNSSDHGHGHFILILLVAFFVSFASNTSCFACITAQQKPGSGETVITNAPSVVTSIVYRRNNSGVVVNPTASPNGSCGHSIYWNAGERPAQYIVGGTSTLNHEFPWQVYLYILSGGSKAFTCGGAVIAPRFVMTAAHCCTHASLASDISVYYGANNLNGTTDNAIFQLKAKKIHQHASYSEITLDYDFCILEMPETYLLKNSGWGVQPICLPTSCTVTCLPGDYAIISGWGLTTEGGSTSDQLLKASVPVLTTASCASSYTNVEPITDIKVCTGYSVGGVSPCTGDSGGPLACFKNGYFTLDGVVSNAVGCAQAAYPAVYSRVCSVKTWIDSILNSSS